jgi:ABC-2 type transport system permease protein
LHGSPDWLHLAALWSTAAASTIGLAAAFARWHFAGYSKSQEARKARFAQWRGLDRAARWLPLSPVRRQLLVKDIKVFVRDVSQWSQLLLLLALVLVYLYNFRVLELDRVPGMSGVIKNAYAFLNMGMAGFVMATVTVRFVFPAVSAEGAAFWIIRSAPISLRDFLWSKFWIGLLPVLVLTECLVVAGNYFLGTDPFLKRLTAGAVAVMAFALVGLAAGLGARYPRFAADNPSQVAGSYGGVAFMVAAVFYVIAMIGLLGWPSSVYLFSQARRRSLTEWQMLYMAAALTTALAMSVAIWLLGMRSGVRALQDMDRTPA